MRVCPRDSEQASIVAEHCAMPGNSLIAVRGYHIRVPMRLFVSPRVRFGELESAWRKIMRLALALASVVLLGAVVRADAQSSQRVLG